MENQNNNGVVILVTAALADHSGTGRLAKHLADHFTVINYDRRGRGKSTDAQPYAVEREVEDIEALIDATGGSALYSEKAYSLKKLKIRINKGE